MEIGNFRFAMPTEIRFGCGVLKNNAALLKIGKRAYIVTGKISGKISGALDDTIEALISLGIEYSIYDGISNNPNVNQCKEVGNLARAFNADFIIGIGGGSPLDAAKAVAVFAVNDIPCDHLFKYGYENGVLPIVAIPTTSGTGSEVTPWSIMTRDDIQTKQSFGGALTFPKVAILDPTYTESLPYQTTLDTALDAFTHCFESYISIVANPFCDSINLSAIKLFYKCIPALESGDHDSIRNELMMVSLMGGFTISNTGTTTMHAMGYPLTYFHNLPHGAANCMVMPSYIKALQTYRQQRLADVTDAIGFKSDELIKFVQKYFIPDFVLTDDEVHLYAQQVSTMSNCTRAGIPCTVSDIENMYKEVFKKL